MSEYQRTMVIEAQPDEVFAFVSDMGNIPQYLPTVRSVEPQAGDRIRLRGESGDKTYDSDGHFRVDKGARRIDWGADGETNYSGWLQVEEGVEEGFTSRVTIHLSFEPDAEMARQLEAQEGGRDQAVNRGIDDTLRSIKNLCEGKGDKVESQSAT